MDTIQRIPAGLLEALAHRGLHITPAEYVYADMTNDGELRHMYLFFDDERLYFIVSAHSDEMEITRGQRKRKPITGEDIGEVYTYPLADMTEAKIINQVVGGLLVLTIAGDENWICRFTSTRMRDMHRFVDKLDRRINPDKYINMPEKAEERDEEEFCPKCGMPYPEVGRPICPKCMKKNTVFLRVLSFFKEYKWRVVMMFICIALSGIFNAVWPYLAGTVLYSDVLGDKAELAISLGLENNRLLMLFYLIIVLFICRLLQQVTGIVHGRMTAYVVPGVVCRIKNAVFSSMQKLSIGFFTRRQTGSLMQRVNNDANEVMGFFIDGFPYLFFNILTVALSLGIMFTLEWRLTLISILLLPPLFFINYRVLPRLWHAHGRRARVTRNMYSILNDDLTGARVVRAFGKEGNENTRFGKSNDRVRKAELDVVKYNQIFSAAYIAVRDLPNILIWTLGAVFILASSGLVFDYGKLITFTGYLSMLQGPMDFFSHVFQWWASSMNSAQRIFEIIDSNPEIVESKNPVQLNLKGDITLNHVNFSYEPNKPVLQDVSFEVKAGEMLGIVGKSGAGKSTLVNLMSRLYDPDSGTITLDGINIKDIAFSSLRGSLAMVSQETYIFMGTVAENIAYAHPEATREEIVKAAIAASAHKFICRLPDGYDTVIGAGGQQLSGGERQRLSIARAILADPQILVLDEATASVDTETERAIQDALDELVKGRTTISIAHRLSTLRNADKLIVLENGKLMESGTHEELVAQKGVYYKLLQLQSKALAMRGVGD